MCLIRHENQQVLQDIRRYFGGSAGKSALTELRASQGSPKRTDKKSQGTRKRPSKKPWIADVVLSDACKLEYYFFIFTRRNLVIS